jgi:hypothetical protein
MRDFVKVLLKDGQVVSGMGEIINGTWIIETATGPIDVYRKVAAEEIDGDWINCV